MSLVTYPDKALLVAKFSTSRPVIMNLYQQPASAKHAHFDAAGFKVKFCLSDF